jgi:hypothetical protein
MPANMVLLEKITVGAAGASSIIFSSIPQTGYTDLKVVASTRGDRNASNAEFFVKFNGATTNFTYRLLQGNATAAASNNGSTGLAGVSDAATNTANTFANSEIYIPNYTSANYKSYSIDSVEENNTTSSPALYTYLIAGLWSNTAAITSIELYPEGSTNWTQYSTFYLYGVAKLGTTPAISPYATGGDTIMTDGTYWYHTFVSSGTFTPQKALSCDYLVVAGGGGGGAAVSGTPTGGGGAGGLRSTVTATGGGGSLESKLSLALGTGYTVTVGAGGAVAAAGNQLGNSGSNSVFSTITSTGGGGGGKETINALSGGSGGGGSYANAAGAGTANQGFAGGAGSTGANQGSGGGGGANAVGQAGSSSNGGNGGAGVATSITGSSVTYAGGGGGATYNGGTAGSGGSGGGGAGGTFVNGTNGTANTGGGGGGAGGSNGVQYYGGQGGSGIVIVRYAI